MSRWFTFFRERTPFASYVIMCLGPSLSGYYLTHKESFSTIIYIFIGFMLFFVELRLMDEYKDFSKDVLAHPNRPLPRGLIDLQEFQLGIKIGLFALLFFDLILYFLGLHLAFVLYSIVIIHLWLMYKEFFIGEWLNQYPIVYAISHQLILIPLCLFAATCEISKIIIQKNDLIYGISVLFAFFSYEVCRKLDPNSHKVLKTYLHVYGMKGVNVIVMTLTILHILVLAFFFKWSSFIFIICLLILPLALLLLNFDKVKFKLTEIAATINLIVFLYAGIAYAIIA